MGCSPSQAVIVQSTKTENAHLHPTIFMVNEKSLQILRELGELNFYHLARYNEAEDTAETLHHDFANQLENPMQYSRDERSTSGRNCQVEERSTCEIKADYVIHVQRHGNELSKDSLTKPAGDKVSHNFTVDSDVKKKSTNTTDSAVLLSVNSLDQANATAKNIGMPGISPNSEPREILIESQNSSSLSPYKTTKHAHPNNLQQDLSLAISASSSRTTDPLDEIISVPVVGCHSPTALSDGGSITPKTKAKMFGRNRIMPKRGVSEKYEAMKSENDSQSYGS